MKKQLLIFSLIAILMNGLILFFLSSIGEYGAKMHYAFMNGGSGQEVIFEFKEIDLKSYLHDNKELLINNQVYDIVAIDTKDGHAKVTCTLDKDETFFVNLIRSNSSALDNMKGQKNIIHLLQYLTLVSCGQHQTFQFCLYQQEQYLSEDKVTQIEHSYELDTPPPQA